MPHPTVLGLHHVTAICGDPERNLDFYAGVLGLRFVKRTVNFDDPETYHFYYGDEIGRPGSILTFFPWPGANPGRAGAGRVAVTSFAMPPAATGFWLERLLRHGVRYEGPRKRETPTGIEPVIAFRDPDGLMLELVGAAGVETRPGWDRAPGIPSEHTLRGFHGIALWESKGDDTERVLAETLGFRSAGAVDGAHRLTAGDGGPGTFIDVRRVGGFPEGFDGVGGVHHVAFRVADAEAQLAVRQRVIEAGLAPTPVIDRQYFRSVYFREPGSVLFELATDGPGFLTDEPRERLGERLQLPPQLEEHRTRLEAVLPPIHPAVHPSVGPTEVDSTLDPTRAFIHRYLPPEPGAEPAALTLLLLHGTGADENDLIPLGRSLLPGASLLSPRGQVLERGMPRFFRRRAEGVFDLEDLAARTEELAGFVAAAPAAYHAPAAVVAVGFSNGANIAVSLLFRRPHLLRGAVLLSPMLPYEPGPMGDLTGTEVFIGAGQQDPTAPAEQVERLARVLEAAGASVTIEWFQGGHTITESELRAARDWLGRSVRVPR